jgi:carboxymethylenebutenolidase
MPGSRVSGYLARLKEPRQQRPAVIVIHENRGLNPFVQDVARRLAAEGFLAYAVDLLSPEGGTPADANAARAMISALDRGVAVKRLVAAVPFLGFHRESNAKVGAVGFCWGGGMVNELAAASRDLKAGVAYYGEQIPGEKVGHIRARLLLHYAEIDPRINAGIAAYETVLKTAGKPHRIYMYRGVHHAFANDTNPARYDKEAAALAWNRTVAFLNEYLK